MHWGIDELVPPGREENDVVGLKLINDEYGYTDIFSIFLMQYN